MKKIYTIPVRFSGRIMYEIEAETEEEAKEKAEEFSDEADCGQLEDIDWEVKEPVDMRTVREEG